MHAKTHTHTQTHTHTHTHTQHAPQALLKKEGHEILPFAYTPAHYPLDAGSANSGISRAFDSCVYCVSVCVCAWLQQSVC